MAEVSSPMFRLADIIASLWFYSRVCGYAFVSEWQKYLY